MSGAISAFFNSMWPTYRAPAPPSSSSSSSSKLRSETRTAGSPPARAEAETAEGRSEEEQATRRRDPDGTAIDAAEMRNLRAQFLDKQAAGKKTKKKGLGLGAAGGDPTLRLR